MNDCRDNPTKEAEMSSEAKATTVKPVSEIKIARDRTVKIYRDCETLNPRLEDEVRSRFLFLHKRHTLGDPHTYKTPQEIEDLVLKMGDIVLAPVFMLEEPNGKLLMDIEPFKGESDCHGQVGLMYMSRDAVEELFMGWNDEARVQALYLLEEELRRYNEWLNDDIYGFVMIDSDGQVLVQETGYFGSDHFFSGLYDDAGVDTDEKGVPVPA